MSQQQTCGKRISFLEITWRPPLAAGFECLIVAWHRGLSRCLLPSRDLAIEPSGLFSYLTYDAFSHTPRFRSLILATLLCSRPHWARRQCSKRCHLWVVHPWDRSSCRVVAGLERLASFKMPKYITPSVKCVSRLASGGILSEKWPMPRTVDPSHSPPSVQSASRWRGRCRGCLVTDRSKEKRSFRYKCISMSVISELISL